MSVLLQLSRPALLGLAAALETGRLRPPYLVSALVHYSPMDLCRDVADELNRLRTMGAAPVHIAYTLNLLAAERTASQHVRDRVELVWTGQELMGSESRDTAVVAHELFNTAKRSVLIASFAIDRGDKARGLFQGLAHRMDANPHLRVRMFLNIQRPHKNEESESILLHRFAHTFRHEIWSGRRLPEVFYDPRSLAMGSDTKACLHAKCLIADEERVLITSANFTEAAHARNIEAGVLLADVSVAKAIQAQFESLVTRSLLLPVPSLS
jgi:hypothetical protein